MKEKTQISFSVSVFGSYRELFLLGILSIFCTSRHEIRIQHGTVKGPRYDAENAEVGFDSSP